MFSDEPTFASAGSSVDSIASASARAGMAELCLSSLGCGASGGKASVGSTFAGEGNSFSPVREVSSTRDRRSPSKSTCRLDLCDPPITPSTRKASTNQNGVANKKCARRLSLRRPEAQSCPFPGKRYPNLAKNTPGKQYNLNNMAIPDFCCVQTYARRNLWSNQFSCQKISLRGFA